MQIDGNNNDLGTVTYAGSFPPPSGNGNTATGVPSPTRPEYPIDFDIDDYRALPLGSVASAAGSQYFDVSNAAPAGTWNGTKWTTGDGVSLPPGIYCSPGEIDVGNYVTVQPASGGDIDGITFVAEGKIIFKSSANFTAWGGDANQDLVVFSNHDGIGSCDEIGVSTDSNSNKFSGIILAKYGIARIRGNAGDTFGGVWGWRVEIYAQSNGVSGPLIGTGGDPEVSLDE